MQAQRNKPKFEQVADRVKQYPYGAGRSQIASDFGIELSTARSHLDKCVSRGLLRRFYGWLTSTSRGWVYIDPAIEDPLPDPDHAWDSGVDPNDHPSAEPEDDLPF